MLIYSMSVSADGFIADREGAFGRSRATSCFTRMSRSAAPAWPRRRSNSASSTNCAFRYPVVVGGDTPFLPPVTEHVPLDLIETRTFGSRVIYERYRRVREDSD